MTTLYNEIDRYCCDWLSNLMDAGLITPGKIDDRRIEDLRPDDVLEYERVHFFAGIAGWDLALRLAGWPAARAVWTGSCPCQPFSAAGQGKAADDIRHLWPDWCRLIRAVRPATVFGEQVESAIGWGWLDLVYDDLEAEGYVVGATVLPACSIGAPHIRNRLWFVADADAARPSEQRSGRLFDRKRSAQRNDVDRRSEVGELADTERPRWSQRRPIAGNGPTASSGLHGVADSRSDGLSDTWFGRNGLASGARQEGDEIERSCRVPWADVEWIDCSDGKVRPTKPGIFPLAHGVSGRVGQLRAAGNAIVPQVAAEFIKAVM